MKKPISDVLKRIAALCLVITCSVARAAPMVSDDFESGTALWTASGTWGTTTVASASPVTSMTDSPGAFYANSTDASLTLATALNFNTISRPVLSFRHRYSLEPGFDYARVEVSTNGGGTWLTPALSFTGESGGFVMEQLDLAPWQTAVNFKVRFRIQTDASVVRDGWYVDDVKIGPAAAPPGLGAITDIARNSMSLNWTAAAAADFAAYEIYRSLTAGVDWRTAWKVATLTDRTNTVFTDSTLAPKTTYYYRVAVVNPDGFRSVSIEKSATTLAGMDFPMLDNGEAGAAIWTADPPWALSTEMASSGTRAWSDSPGGTYAASIASQALTLSAPVNLSAATEPVLCFRHRHDFAPGDYGYVEVSTNSGTDWSSLATFSSTSPGTDWQRARISLAAHRQAAVLVRFRFTSDPGTVADGWHLDDISLTESPLVMPAPAVDQITSNSVRLTWLQSADPMVTGYLVMRSPTAGVTVNSTLAGTLNSAASTTFTDTGLLLDTNYYYRVYAVNRYGGISADSAVEALAHTLNNPPPFADGFEGGTQGWIFNGTWGVTSEIAATGAKCLTDSPGASYAPSTDTWAETSVDLRTSVWPVLTFRDRYSLSGGDWLRVEVYDANQTWVWSAPYGAMESAPRTAWRLQQLDLSPFKGRANVRVRFRIATDGGTPGDGWFIDDVAVTENALAATPQTLPLQESFETGLANWLAAGWIQADTVAAKEGTKYAWDSDNDRMGPSTSTALVLARPVVLPAGSNVQVTFFMNGDVTPGTALRLQYSEDAGVSWPELSSANLDAGVSTGTGWRRLQASLQSLAGKTVRLRLVTSSDQHARAENVRIDKLTIAEMPAAVTLTSAVPALRSVALTWSASTLGAAFQRTEVWRSTAANVTVQSGTKVHESAAAAAGPFTDTGLAIGSTYYYRVFTVDTRDTYIPSNELSALTVPSAIPFADPMESASNWVPGTTGAANTWGIASTGVHGGSGCLALVAAGQYAINSDTWMETAVDLTGAEWPVLKFWDRYALGEGDWLRVEVYDAVQTWVQIIPHGAMGPDSRTFWREQHIDLSQFRGRSNVRIRFRVATDGATPSDGWFIDDLSLAENPLRGTPQSLPLLEGFESGTANWVTGNWSVSNAISAAEGTKYVWDADQLRMGPSASEVLTLARPLVLPAGSNVQVTFHVNGEITPGSSFRLQYSEDGGVSWPELGTANLDAGFSSGTDWRRLQASLQPHAGKTVRLRMITSSDQHARAEDIRVDKLTIAEMPAAVTLVSALPALRSVALTWTASTLGAAFQRYEVWRSTAANVTVLNGTKLFESATTGTTSFTDTGLAIGSTYYYRVFTVDSRGTYIPSNESAATTVPSLLPFTDAMETMGNWVPGSTGAANTWGVASSGVHGGSGALALSPAGQYAVSSDTWVETAVDLSTAQWPVLKFWDRYAMGEGDWVRVEIFDSNQTWVAANYYGLTGPDVRTAWREQQLDLSPFKGRSNVRIRFRAATDGATPSDGWFIDDVSLTENALASSPQTLPLQEGFESGMGNWLASDWTTTSAIAAKEGTAYAWDSDHQRMGPSTSVPLVLARPVVLPAGSNVQVTFWANGYVGPGSSFRLQYSEDGGINWPELTTANLDAGFDTGTDWRRLQASLQSLAGKTVRLRFVSSSDQHARVQDVRLDKMTIAAMPAAVTLTSAVPVLRSVSLAWTQSTLGTAFRRYELWRSTAANVTVQNGTKVAEISDPGTLSFTDTGLLIGQPYFYRVFTVDERDTFIPSNELAATTVPSTLPFSDAMETTGNWMPGTTGAANTWGIATGNAHGGSGCLALMPAGQYANSSDTWMETSIDLRGTVWPVLKFWDRFALGDGDWLRVEVYDGDQTWYSTIHYGVHGPTMRSTWREQQIDLSEFKGRGHVRVRLRVATDGGTPAEGWFIDDLSVVENPTGAVPLTMPAFTTMETPHAALWQASGWASVTDATTPGNHALLDTENARCGPSVSHTLTLAQPVVLPAGTQATVAFRVRGMLPPGSAFRLQYSEDGGTSWPELPAANLDAGFDRAAWQRMQIPLTTLGGKTVRLRFISSSDQYARASDIYLDDIGIGLPEPDAPVLISPIASTWVSDVRPLLTLQNAIDVQSDPLTYRFEVYSDAALSTLVSQVPAVAGGTSTTAWQVDVNLPNNTRYWWRARASDGTSTGPWSDAADFYVNEVNHVPGTVVQAGPAAGAALPDLTERLFWNAPTDADAGDFITAYHIQIAADAAFTAPVVNVSDIAPPSSPARSNAEPVLSVTLASLAGSTGLVPGTRYWWRIRAADNRSGWSAWQTAPRSFRFGQSHWETWLAGAFSSAELADPAISGPGADPDSDGVPNLLEFAAGTMPRDTSSRAVPQVAVVDGYLRISWRQRRGGTGIPGISYTAAGLSYVVETAPSPAGPWSAGAGSIESVGSPADNGDGIETATARSAMPVSSGNRQFLRVRITLLP